MNPDNHKLAEKIKTWARELGFPLIGITDTNVSEYQKHYTQWLEKKHHGEMHYLEKHQDLRFAPENIVPNTHRIIVAGMPYPLTKNDFISPYAASDDYHTLIKKQLKKLALKIEKEIGDFHYRVFCDSAPVCEKTLGQKAGLGWIGKNSLLIHPAFGSLFFLGELFVDIILPIDSFLQTSSCKTCDRCINACPTNAIHNGQIDANRCISYLTIEHKGAIPIALRPLVGQHIFGCAKCQTVCPWNQTISLETKNPFEEKNPLMSLSLVEAFLLSKKEFDEKAKGTVIKRISYEQWLRNIAVALGNSPQENTIKQALKSRLDFPSALVREHVEWALEKF